MPFPVMYVKGGGSKVNVTVALIFTKIVWKCPLRKAFRLRWFIIHALATSGPSQFGDVWIRSYQCETSSLISCIGGMGTCSYYLFGVTKM